MKFFGDIKKWFDNQELLFYLIDMFQEQHVTSALTYTSGHEKNILMTTGISSRTTTMKTAHLDGIGMRKDDFKMPKEKGQGKRASCYYFVLILDIKF